jgi:hypothetical protein
MNKILSLLTFILLTQFLQAQTLRVEGKVTSLNLSDCGDCNGSADPRIKARVSTTAQPWSAEYRREQDNVGCSGGLNTDPGTYIATGVGNGEEWWVQIRGFESDGFICGGDDGDCDGYSPIANYPILSNYAPNCNGGYHTGSSTRTCTSGGTQVYTALWQFRYHWEAGSLTDANAGGAIAFSVPANSSNCGDLNPAVINGNSLLSDRFNTRQWQVSVNGGAYGDIAGATGQNYDPGNLTIVGGAITTYTFRRRLNYCTNFANGVTSVFSNTLTITLNPPATVSAGVAQTICAGSTATMSGSFGGGATSAIWTTSGTGGFSNNTPTAVYTPSVGDIAAGSVTLTYTTNDPTGPCPSVNASIVLTINPAATVSAGLNQTICAGSTATMAGAFGGGASSATWTTSGTGGFNNNTPTAVYTPSLADRTAGSVILTYTTNDPAGPCPAVSATMTLTINPAATVSAGGNQTICSGSTATMAGSFGGGATSAVWTSSGTGGFSNNTPTAVYTPSAGDISAGSVVLTYTTNDPAGPCPAASSSMTLTINLAATANAGATVVVCQSATPSAITLSGASVGGGASTGAWSIVSGGGTLSSTGQSATPGTVTYTPAANFTGNVSLLLTTNDPDGAGPCTAVTSTRTITVDPAATVSAGVNQTICSNTNATMAGSFGGGATSATWTSSGTGGFSNNTPTAIYTPSAADITAGSVVLTYTTNDPAGPCNSVSASMILTINPAATVSAGNNQTICEGSTAIMAGAFGGGGNLSYLDNKRNWRF